MRQSFVWLASLALLGAGFSPDLRERPPAGSPYQALVKINVDGGLGSGILIGPDLVLTCAHAITDGQGEIRQGGWVEVDGQHVQVNGVYYTPHWNHDPASGEDWAILRLTRPMGWRYGWVECLSLDNQELQDLKVEIAGFTANPDEARPELAGVKDPYRCPGQVRDVGEHILFHDCSMWGGASGSPLLVRSPEGEYKVVAVNSAGVGVEGEELDHGFRQTYSRPLANIAVPVRNFALRLSGIPVPTQSPFRRLEVRNESDQTTSIRVRYHSLLDQPEEVETKWTEVAPQQTVCVVDVVHGWPGSTVEVAWNNLSNWQKVELHEGDACLLVVPAAPP